MEECRRDQKSACPERYKAIRDGRCWYSWEAKGWFTIVRGIPTRYDHCRWCGGRLPTLTDSILRALAEHEDDAS